MCVRILVYKIGIAYLKFLNIYSTALLEEKKILERKRSQMWPICQTIDNVYYVATKIDDARVHVRYLGPSGGDDFYAQFMLTETELIVPTPTITLLVFKLPQTDV